MAEIYNAEMAPHLYSGPVEWAANVHFAASIPNLLIAETIETGGSFHQKLIKNSIKLEDGHILPPEAPGLGIDFDEDVARAILAAVVAEFDDCTIPKTPGHLERSRRIVGNGVPISPWRLLNLEFLRAFRPGLPPNAGVYAPAAGFDDFIAERRDLLRALDAANVRAGTRML